MSKNKQIRKQIENNKDIILKTHGDQPLIFDGLLGTDDEFKGVVYLLKETTKTGYEKYRKNQADKYPGEYPQNAWDFAATTTRIIRTPEERIESVWTPLCYWTEAYKEALNEKECHFSDYKGKYEYPPKGNYENCDYSILKEVALVNIKKTAGESTTDHKLLETAVEKYGDLLRDELDTIDPSVVVCCGTFDCAVKLYGIQSNEIETFESGARYFIKEDTQGKEIFYIEFVHPSCRVKTAVTYAYAKDVFADYRKKKDNP